MSIDKNKIQTAVRMILEAVGENPDREGLADTPARVARMYEEVLEDYMRIHLNIYKYILVKNTINMC